MRKNSELVLRKQKDFNRIYKKGNSRGSRFTVILYRKNELGYTRTAYVASRKVGDSVRRNRARRLIREAYRSFSNDIIQGYDIIFVARSSINDQNMQEVRKNLSEALRSCGLMNGPSAGNRAENDAKREISQNNKRNHNNIKKDNSARNTDKRHTYKNSRSYRSDPKHKQS
jgi:ribonuclease P protein component